MPPRERVALASEEGHSLVARHQPLASIAPQPAPWGGTPGPALLSTLQATTDVAGSMQEQPATFSTEVDAFEPLPDSPTNKHGGLGSGFDQHQQQQQQQQHAAHSAKASRQRSPQHRGVEGIQAPSQGPRPGTAHMHLIGEVTGAFGLGCEPLYCTWMLVYDAQIWSVVRGLDKGRTHASSPLQAEDGGLTGVVWECPVDLLLATTSAQHWPSIVFKLFHRSIWLGREAFVGYGLAPLPNTPGCHHISCPVWVATEGHTSLSKELTKLFTGLHPQLVNEAFITDLEQRYEQGQHLHTLGCSSGGGGGGSCMPEFAPGSYAVTRLGGASGPGGAAGGLLGRPFCRSFSAAGSGGTMAAGAASAAAGAAAGGGRIVLRLHVLTRGMEGLARWRGDGGESIGRCLERLHSNVDKLRQQHGRRKAELLGDDGEAGDGDEGRGASEAEESEGVQLVRAGRADRLAAVQRSLFSSSRDSDSRGRPRDQQQQQQQQQQPTGGESGTLLSYAGGSSRFSSDRDAANPPTSTRATFAAAGSSDARLGAGRFGSSGGSSGAATWSPLRGGTTAAAGSRGSAWGGQQPAAGLTRPLGASPGLRRTSRAEDVVPEPATGRPGSGASPLRSTPVGGSRWAGRFAAAPGEAGSSSHGSDGSPVPTC